MTKRVREIGYHGEEKRLTYKKGRFVHVQRSITLGDVHGTIGFALIETLRFGSPFVLIAVNKGWNRFFALADEEEPWDKRLERWKMRDVTGERELARLNPHERDFHVDMNEILHKYTIIYWNKETKAFPIVLHSRPKDDPDRYFGLMSVTTFIDTLFEEFDADKVIKKMMASRNWPSSKYYGKTPDEIKKEWDTTRDEASTAGTAMHLNLENYYNGKEYDSKTPEFLLFDEYNQEILSANEIEPYRSEQMVFDIPLMLSGSIDMQYCFRAEGEKYDKQGRLRIKLVDWKRSKELKKWNQYQKGKSPLTDAMDDCNFNHYVMQLRIYKLILERNYNVVVVDMYLIILHPNQKKYIKVSITCTPLEIARIIRYRRKQLTERKK